MVQVKGRQTTSFFRYKKERDIYGNYPFQGGCRLEFHTAAAISFKNGEIKSSLFAGTGRDPERRESAPEAKK